MSTLGKSPQFGIYQRMDAITGTSDSSYTLNINNVPQPNFIAEQLIVSVNGVIQAPNSAYTVTGSTITFAEAIDSTDAIDFITAMGHAHSTSTVSDNTITDTSCKTSTMCVNSNFTVSVLRRYSCNPNWNICMCS